MATISIKSLDKRYNTYHAVRDIDLEIPDRAFTVLVGPSGCGKSTTLRMIAGLEDISGGDVEFDGKRVNELSPAARDIAMVFQNYALYPHMSVRRNIAFGLEQRRVPKAEIAREVDAVSKLLELDSLLDRKPRELSGGQRQRVAMGRAMVRTPSVFLYDEPLSNLDAKLRVQMRTEIKRLHQANPVTTIYVTHDQTEAMTLADIVVVMNKGRIEQVGPPQELYFHPKTAFVAQFVGSPSMNFFEVELAEAKDGGLNLKFAEGVEIPVPASRTESYRPFIGKPLHLGVRPEDLAIADEGIPVSIDVVEPLGQETIAFFRRNGNDCALRLDPLSDVKPGAALKLFPNMERAHLIDRQSDNVIPRAVENKEVYA